MGRSTFLGTKYIDDKTDTLIFDEINNECGRKEKIDVSKRFLEVPERYWRSLGCLVLTCIHSFMEL